MSTRKEGYMVDFSVDNEDTMSVVLNELEEMQQSLDRIEMMMESAREAIEHLSDELSALVASKNSE